MRVPHPGTEPDRVVRPHRLIASTPPALLCTLLLISATAPRHSTAQTTGTITGTVSARPSGEPLAGVLVAVEGYPFGTYTDSRGRYRIMNLTPGTYEIHVSLIGYRETTIRGIRVRAGRGYVQDVEIDAAPIPLEGTIIEAERIPILQPDVTEARQTVLGEEIREMPVDNIQDIIELQASVINGTIRGGRIGQEIYVIDGVSVKNFLEGSQEGLGLDVGTLSVRELSVVSSGFAAENGQALSGVINLVTKEGGMKPEAAVRITSDAPIPDEDSYGYNRLELSFGGPIGDRGRVRYFVAADGSGRFDASPTAVTLHGTDGEPLPRLPHNEGDALNLFAKITWWPTADLKLSGSLLTSRDQHRLYDPRYRYNLENTLSERSRGRLLNFTLNRIRSASASRASLLDARVSLYRGDRYLGVLEPGWFDDRADIFGFSLRSYRFRGESFVDRDPLDQLASGSGIPGYTVPAATGENAFGVQDTSIFIDTGQNPVVVRTLYEFADIGVDWENRFERELSIKTGGEVKLNHARAYQRLNAYLPGGLPNFVEFYPVLGASYVQGTVTAPGLVIDLGLRFDAFLPRIDFAEDVSLPALGVRSSEDKYALNPRLGTTVLLGERDLFRINYGVFRQTPDFQYLFDVAFSDPFRAGTRRRGNPELQFEKTNMYEITYSHAFTNDLSVSAGAYVKQLEHLVASRVTDLMEPQNARFSNDDFGEVRGMEIIAKKRMNNILGFTFSYNYQHAMGMASNAFDLFSNVVFDARAGEVVGLPTAEFPLDFDQRHTANLTVEARLPERCFESSRWRAPFSGLHIYSTMEFGSGLPFTRMRIDSTMVGARVDETLVPAEAPNASRLPPTFEWSLRLSRGFRLGEARYTLFADIRNLLGRRNVRFDDPFTHSPWNSEARLRRLAATATANAVDIPAESAAYRSQADLDGDRVMSASEQEESYYRALADRWEPVLSYGEPRQVRFGMDVRF